MPQGSARKTSVTVRGKSYEVLLAQTGKVTWTASGWFDGEHFSETGRSESAALTHLQRVAERLKDWP